MYIILLCVKDELMSFLSLCRMLDWPQIHWLKLFAVLVGTLNDVSELHHLPKI